MDYISAAFSESEQLLSRVMQDELLLQHVQKSIKVIVDCLEQGGKIMTCGNGGSLCDSLHFAEELTGRYRKERRPLAAMSLSDPAHMSCVSNDFGHEEVFSRSIEALGQKRDVLLAISTSGNSLNILNAVSMAKKKEMTTVALLGKGGGKVFSHVDIPLLVPSHTTDRIQEIHIKIIHIMIEGIERYFFPQHYQS